MPAVLPLPRPLMLLCSALLLMLLSASEEGGSAVSAAAGVSAEVLRPSICTGESWERSQQRFWHGLELSKAPSQVLFSPLWPSPPVSSPHQHFLKSQSSMAPKGGKRRGRPGRRVAAAATGAPPRLGLAAEGRLPPAQLLGRSGLHGAAPGSRRRHRRPADRSQAALISWPAPAITSPLIKSPQGR